MQQRAVVHQQQGPGSVLVEPSLLGLEPPWTVIRIELNVEDQRVNV